MPLAILVAMSENRVIGREGDMPWHLSADLRRFKQLTMGHTIIMGRKTFDSIGRPLPGRRTIVVSRKPDLAIDGVEIAAGIDTSLELADADDVFIVGGGQIYQEALPLAELLLVTRVHANVEGDTYFPPIDADHWRLTLTEHHEADAQNDYPYSFETYERVSATTP